MPVTAEMTMEEKRRLEEDLREELVRRAIDQRAVPTRDEAIIRDLMPGDLGAVTEVFTQILAVPVAWNTTYTVTLTAKRLVGIYGIKNKSAVPLTTGIRFGLGAGPAKIKDQWEVESAWLELNTESLTTQPIIYDKDSIITIQQYAAAAGVDGVIYLGLVCEPAGDVVTH